jgi:hypothetical protein
MSRIGWLEGVARNEESCDLSGFVSRGGRGTCVAVSVGVRLGAAFSAMFFMGCLVTDPIDFPEELTCPPSIETRPSCTTDSTPPCHPLNQVVVVDLDLDVPESGMGELLFEVDIRDCNEDQSLQTLALLDYRPDFGTPFGQALVEDGTRFIGPPERSPFEFRLPFSRLAATTAGRCHKLELLVSSRFRDVTSTQPAEQGDIGSAVWWIAVTDTANPSVEMTACP